MPEHCIVIDWAAPRGEAPGDREISRWIGATLDRHLDRGAEVDLRIVDADEMQEFNHQYRNKDRPTNVLSFPADLHPDVEATLLGDLLLCAPVAADEARRQGKALADHWAHLLIHGTLHLLGFDHIDESGAERMESEERTVLAGFGIADPYR